MKKVVMLVGLSAMLLGTSAFADSTLSLVGPAAPVLVDSFFDVFVELDTDVDIAMVQVVLENLDPSITLEGVTSGLASLAFINAPDTAVADYFPTSHTGAFTAMVLQMKATAVGTYALDGLLVDQSSFSSALFDALYSPLWSMTIVGGSVEVIEEQIIPEPVTMSMLALVGLGGVIASRKRS